MDKIVEKIWYNDIEKLIEEFKRKMYLDGKSARTTEVYSNSVKEVFSWFY